MEFNDAEFLHKVIDAIAESYTSIVCVDIRDGRSCPIRFDDYSSKYKEEFSLHPSMHDITKRYVEDVVFCDDREGVMRLTDLEYVTKRLETENPILHVYRTLHNEKVTYYRIKVVPIDDGNKLIYGFENIDSEYRKQMHIKNEKEMQMLYLKGLSREFLSVWYLDGKSRKVRLIHNNGTDMENGEAVRIGNTMVDYHFSMQKYFGLYVDPEDFDRLMEETSYEMIVKNAGDNDLYSINYVRINTDKTRSNFQVCYAKIVDDAGIANFVFGYRNLDKIAEK